MADKNLETYSLIWLDASVNNSKENLDAQQRLRSLINHLKTFEQIDQCEQYIQSVSPQDRIVLVISGLKIFRKFEKDYVSDRSLWWYTRESFLYRLMNKALRVQNIDLLFLFRFLIRDIRQQLKQHRCSSFIRLYRGQLILNEEI